MPRKTINKINNLTENDFTKQSDKDLNSKLKMIKEMKREFYSLKMNKNKIIITHNTCKMD